MYVCKVYVKHMLWYNKTSQWHRSMTRMHAFVSLTIGQWHECMHSCNWLWSMTRMHAFVSLTSGQWHGCMNFGCNRNSFLIKGVTPSKNLLWVSQPMRSHESELLTNQKHQFQPDSWCWQNMELHLRHWPLVNDTDALSVIHAQINLHSRHWPNCIGVIDRPIYRGKKA